MSKAYKTTSDMVRAIASPDFADQFDERLLLKQLLAASEAALAHVRELREAWRTGAIDERDGGGGTRSNRNVDVEVALRDAVEKAHAMGFEVQRPISPANSVAESE